MAARAARNHSRALSPGDFWIPLVALWAILLAVGELEARAADAGSTNAVVPAELILERPSLWSPFFEVRTAVGYKDNLLLSHTERESSGFVGVGADVAIGRLPLDGRQFNLLVSAEDRRYWQGHQVDHEDLALALAQGKLGVDKTWQFGVDARYLYQDEVVDTSVTETNLEATRVRGHLAGLLPNVRWSLAHGAWLEASGTAQRGWFAAPLDDYWEGGPKLAAGHDYGHRSSVQLSYGLNWRDYDTREQTSLSGTNLPGTALGFDQHEVGLAWQHSWDAPRRWRTGLRLAWQTSRDNGPGYYDYMRYFAAPQVRWVAAEWDLKLEAKFTYYDFSQRPAEPGSTDTRAQSTVALNLRAQRGLGKGFKLFAEYELEQSFSNQATEEYRVNTVAAGVLFEF